MPVIRKSKPNPELITSLNFEQRLATARSVVLGDWANAAPAVQSVALEMLFRSVDCPAELPLMGVGSTADQKKLILGLALSLAEQGFACSQMVSSQACGFRHPTLGGRIFFMDKKAFSRLAGVGAVEWSDYPGRFDIENSSYWSAAPIGGELGAAARAVVCMAYEDSPWSHVRDLSVLSGGRAHVDLEIRLGAHAGALAIAAREAGAMRELSARGVDRAAAAARKFGAGLIDGAPFEEFMARAWSERNKHVRTIMPWINACVGAMEVDAEKVLRPLLLAMEQSEPAAAEAARSGSLGLIEKALDVGAMGCARALLDFGASALSLHGGDAPKLLGALVKARDLALKSRGLQKVSELSSAEMERFVCSLAIASRQELVASGQGAGAACEMVEAAMGHLSSSFSRGRARSALEALAIQVSLLLNKPGAAPAFPKSSPRL